MFLFLDFHPVTAGDIARGGCNRQEALICVQSIKHLHRALVARSECAGFLTVRCGPAKPAKISPEHFEPLFASSFYNPISAFN